jgi:hypothetical protein
MMTLPPEDLSPSARRERPTKTTLESARPTYCLNVLVLYQDTQTRQWAGELCERVAGLISHEAVRTTWWKMDELGEPAVLAGAVSTAMRADIILTAVHAAEGFPLAFYMWVDAWLPHRPRGAGALAALIALPERMTPQLDRPRDYLQALARKGRLDFLIEERKISSLTQVQTPGLESRPPRLSSGQPERFNPGLADRRQTLTLGALKSAARR